MVVIERLFWDMILEMLLAIYLLRTSKHVVSHHAS